MKSWNGANLGYLLKAYYKNNDSYVSAQRVFRTYFNIPHNDPVPSPHAMKILIKKFEKTGFTLEKKIGSVKSVHTPVNVARMEDALQGSLTRSTRRHAVSLLITDRNVRRILHEDLHYQPYKTEIVHALKDVDHANRLAFYQQLLIMINENPNNLLMSGDAHFHLSGFVNKQNFHYWSSENSQRLQRERDSLECRLTV